MPRPWTETVCDWLEIKQNEACSVCVVRIDKTKKPTGLKVTLEHTERDQLGRQHVTTLPMPCRPGGPTADFFRACGQRVEPGSQIQPKQCIGKTILVRFEPALSGELEPANFEPLKEETHNGRQSESTVSEPAPRTGQLLDQA